MGLADGRQQAARIGQAGIVRRLPGDVEGRAVVGLVRTKQVRW
jgi:hypothetical protein